MSQRTEQVNAEIQKMLGQVMNEDVELPENHLVTVSRVNVAPDLKTAQVYVSILPFDSSGKIFKILKSQKSRLQKELHKNLSMKFSPIIEFILDEQEEYADKIERLIDSESLGN